MDAISTHREALRWAYDLLTMVMADVTPELAQTTPPGIANPLAAIYAHAVLDLDMIPSFILQQKLPLYQSTWKGKTGISNPQWQMSFEWARSVQVDLPAAREFAQAAYEKADEYLTSFTDTDLAREIDLTEVGLGKRSLNWCISALVISHLNNMIGEISVLKGIQGVKGYPF